MRRFGDQAAEHCRRIVDAERIRAIRQERQKDPSVATAELEHTPAVEDQLFRFTWRGGEWLAYGLRDGRVRGVYCPEHNARRTERCSFGYRVGVVAS